MKTCPHCGALNEAGFERCVRCARSLAWRPPPEARKEAIFPSNSPILRLLDGQRLLATKTFIALTLLVFGGQAMSAIARGNAASLLFGANLEDDLRFGALLLSDGHAVFDTARVMAHEPWRLLSAVFVHFGLVHFGFNMLALVQLGRQAELAIGSARFTVVYVVSGIAGFVASTAWVALRHGDTFTAGASGAIFGIMGLFAGVLWRWGDPRWKPVAMQSVFYLLFAAAIFPANNAAHLGGMLAGAAVGALFAPRLRNQQRPWEIALGALCLIACVASLVLAQRSDVAALAARLAERG